VNAFVARRAVVIAWLAWLACFAASASVFAGCSFDESANPQHDCSGCPAGQCYRGFCLSNGQNQFPATGTAATGGSSNGSGKPGAAGTSAAGVGGNAGGGNAGSAGSDSTAAGTTAPLPCTPNSECYSADVVSLGVGSCRAGQCDASGTCIGEILPMVESCNALDDDCDGATDEDVELGSCDSASSMGACVAGVMACEGGVSICRAAEPQPEQCNGVDDDCDGNVDNGLGIACYPDATVGCTQDSAGGFTCVGRCAAGVRQCVAGAMAECTGMTTPAVETCGDDDPGDEDCDGKVDEGCMCSGSATQRCYTGPAFTAGVGICRRGEQQCVNGTFGACTGSIVPTAETCANAGADDDCNLFVDDVPRLNTACSTGKLGECRNGTRVCRNGALVCVGPSPKPDTTCDGLDEDCNGTPDDTFAFMTDEAHCGSCTVKCMAGATCCGGHCAQTDDDPNNCGGCGVVCGASKACCGGHCLAINTVDHCGGCGGCDTSKGEACCGNRCIVANTPTQCGASCMQCPAGQDCCNGACTDTKNDKMHCGSCNAPICNNSCCDGACIDTSTSATHCGSCTAPACTGATSTCCAGSCVDTQTDKDHCGKCETACAACCAGSCATPKPGQNPCGMCTPATCAGTCCDQSCMDTQVDPNNCGTCGHVCASMCTCMAGNCVNAEGQACLPPG
jgi:hypothetical protein